MRAQVHVPVAIGSGVDPKNLPTLWPLANAFIVGSYIKRDGLWSNDIDPDRCATLIAIARQLKTNKSSTTAPPDTFTK